MQNNLNEHHEWVSTYTDFEAVLVCKNTLNPWEREASIRAFQTYGWNDASTGGDEQIFHHEDAGVMVRYDGDVVAIEFAGEQLNAALGDLFQVFYALGWRDIEVYHPINTMSLLLGDMGKAIPAAMDLDVKPAKQVSDGNGSIESRALIEQGRALMRNAGMEAFDSVALQQFQELGALANFDESTGGHMSVVMDDEPGAASQGDVHEVSWEPLPDGFHEPRGFNASFENVENFNKQGGADTRGTMLDDDPPVVSLQAYGETPVGNHEPVSDVSTPSIVQQDYAISQRVEVGTTTGTSHLPDEVHAGFFEPAWGEHLQETASADMAMAVHRAMRRSTDERFLRLGRVSLGFDVPSDPLDETHITAEAQAMGTKIVDHIWPGLPDQALRWDFMGEFDDAHPAMAEVCAEALGVGEAGRALLVAQMLTIRRTESIPQLRDLIVACALAVSNHDALNLDGHYLPLKAALQESYKSDGINFLREYSGLLAYRSGHGFVDIQDTGSEERDSMFDRFTVRALRDENKSRLLIVHLDSTDGSSIVRLVGAMRHVAKQIARSTRADKMKQAARDSEFVEHEKKRQALLSAAAEQIGPIVMMLRDAGIAV